MKKKLFSMFGEQANSFTNTQPFYGLLRYLLFTRMTRNARLKAVGAR